MDSRRFGGPRFSALGRVGSSRGGALSPTRLCWTDRETGERLEVELWSSPAFRAELESIGFESVFGRDDAADLAALGEEAV